MSDGDQTGDTAFVDSVYDKLWQNVIHKENRLWTFLTVYGAAIGFVVGSGDSVLIEFQRQIIVLILTYWAAEITVDTDWWSVRNRLMIRGIERKRRPETSGVIPSFYHEPNFSGESLHGVTLLVFAAIGLVVFGIGVWDAVRASGQAVGVANLQVLGMLSFIALAVIRILHVREKRISEYYDTLDDLNKQEPVDERLNTGDIDKARLDNWKKLSWRKKGGAIYGVGFVMAAWALNSLPMGWWLAGIVGQAVVVLVLFTRVYQKPNEQVLRKQYVGFRLARESAEESCGRPIIANRIMLVAFILSMGAWLTAVIWLQNPVYVIPR